MFNKRINIEGDGWCVGDEFFIQTALFNITGHADWKLIIKNGNKHNKTYDGEYHRVVIAERINEWTLDNESGLTYKFDVHGNTYSYQSIYQNAYKSILNTTPFKWDRKINET